MKANVVGNYFQENVVFSALAASGTTPIVQVMPLSVENLDTAGFVFVTTGNLTGAWLIEASNDYVSANLPGLNQTPNAGHWADVTALFGPSGFATVAAASSKYAQNTSALGARHLRITFTPATNSGTISCFYCGKGGR